jgi:hypothetical protein
MAVNSLPLAAGRIDVEAPRAVRREWEHAFVPTVADRYSYSYLLGMYLGDGHIGDTGRTYQLRITLDALYPGIVEECVTAVQLMLPAGRICVRDRPGWRVKIVDAGWKRWPELFPQHGPGRKHERPIVLADWQELIVEEHPWCFLRGLLHSDGCRTVNRFEVKLPSGRVGRYEYPRWFFSNLSQDILGLFCRTCERLGIRWTRSNHRNISVSYRHSVALLEEHIGPKC